VAFFAQDGVEPATRTRRHARGARRRRRTAAAATGAHARATAPIARAGRLAPLAPPDLTPIPIVEESPPVVAPEPGEEPLAEAVPVVAPGPLEEDTPVEEPVVEPPPVVAVGPEPEVETRAVVAARMVDPSVPPLAAAAPVARVRVRPSRGEPVRPTPPLRRLTSAVLLGVLSALLGLLAAAAIGALAVVVFVLVRGAVG